MRVPGVPIASGQYDVGQAPQANIRTGLMPGNNLATGGQALMELGDIGAQLAAKRKLRDDTVKSQSMLNQMDAEIGQRELELSSLKGSDASGASVKHGEELRKIYGKYKGMCEGNSQLESMFLTDADRRINKSCEFIGRHEQQQNEAAADDTALGLMDAAVRDAGGLSIDSATEGEISPFEQRLNDTVNKFGALGFPPEKAANMRKKLADGMRAGYLADMSEADPLKARETAKKWFDAGDIDGDTLARVESASNKAMVDQVAKRAIETAGGDYGRATNDILKNGMSWGLDPSQIAQAVDLVGGLDSQGLAQQERDERQAMNDLSPKLGLLLQQGRIGEAEALINQNAGSLGSSYFSLSGQLSSYKREIASHNRQMALMGAEQRKLADQQRNAAITGKLIQGIVSGQIKDKYDFFRAGLTSGLTDWDGNVGLKVLEGFQAADSDAFKLAEDAFKAQAPRLADDKKFVTTSSTAGFMKMLADLVVQENLHGSQITKAAQELIGRIPVYQESGVLTRKGLDTSQTMIFGGSSNPYSGGGKSDSSALGGGAFVYDPTTGSFTRKGSK